MLTYRKTKKIVAEVLADSGPFVGMEKILAIPPVQAVNALFPAFCSMEDSVRHRAAAAMGMVVSRMAESGMEPARTVMRRLMWSLNDESGGIGWGAPEAMGEILSRNPELAGEYTSILVSYIMAEGNYLELPGLQRGAVWAIGRLARVRKEIMGDVLPRLVPYIRYGDPGLRGIAIWAAIPLNDGSLDDLLEGYRDDDEIVEIFQDGRMVALRTGDLALEAMV
jgi:hypothetical protein